MGNADIKEFFDKSILLQKPKGEGTTIKKIDAVAAWANARVLRLFNELEAQESYEERFAKEGSYF